MIDKALNLLPKWAQEEIVFLEKEKFLKGAAIERLENERSKLVEDKRELMKALEWYADERNHFPRTVHEWVMKHEAGRFAPIYGDLGERAQAVLDKIRTLENKDEG